MTMFVWDARNQPMALSEKWIPLRENDIYDLSDKKHDRREKPANRSDFSSGTEQNLSIPLCPSCTWEDVWFSPPATCRIYCNIRAGAFVKIACTHKQCDVLKCTHKKRSPSLGEISLNGQFHTPANFFGVWRFNMLYAGLTVRLFQIRKAQKISQMALYHI